MAASDWRDAGWLPLPLLRITVMCQLLDVVHQAVELPLRIHLLLPSQGEAVELFVMPQIAEHRFHRGEASSVLCASCRAVDAGFHFVGEACLLPRRLAPEERDLPGLGLARGA